MCIRLEIVKINKFIKVKKLKIFDNQRNAPQQYIEYSFPAILNVYLPSTSSREKVSIELQALYMIKLNSKLEFLVSINNVYTKIIVKKQIEFK